MSQYVLTDRSCILTGASRGIGLALARRLSKEGMRLGLLARSEAPLRALAEELSAGGPAAYAFPVDVSDAAALAGVVEEAVGLLGGIDVVVNNAGVEDFQHFLDSSPEGIQQSVLINVAGPLVLTRLALPHMLEKGGRVVNLGSAAGLAGTPYGATYAATKAAIQVATASLRQEYADSAVRFSVVMPGFVLGAGMHELQKEQTGEEAPRALGSTTVEQVVEDVVRAIRTGAPEIISNSVPLRPSLALGRLTPGLADKIVLRLSGGYMRRLADARHKR